MVLAGSTRLRSLWTPERISTVMWLDADDNSTITLVSGAVSQWSDKSGNNRHVTQGTAANRPTVATNVIGGKQVIRFDGSNDALSTASALYTTASLGIYCVALNRNSSGESAMFGQYVSTSSGRTLFYGNGSSIRSAALFTGSTGVSFNQTANTDPHILGFHINGANAELFYEAVSRGTASNFPNTIANTLFDIGNMSNGGVTIVSAIDMAEIICLSAPASTNIRQKIEGYLAHKWGLEANLPSTHPFKDFPPRGA